MRVLSNDDKRTRNLLSFDPVNFDVSEIYEGNVPGGMFSPDVTWHSYVVTPWQPFYEKRAKSLENSFSPALEMQFCRFY